MDYIQPIEFDFDAALALLESADPFPIDFDAAWQWLGYSRKDNAKRALVENFIKDFDFLIFKESDNHAVLSVQERAVASKKEIIKLTTDCFKSFCMMAGTEKGKEVRRYFLECEHQLKQVKSQIIAPRQQEQLPGTKPYWMYLLIFLRGKRDKKFSVQQLAKELDTPEKLIRPLLIALYHQDLIGREYILDLNTGAPEYLYWAHPELRLRKKANQQQGYVEPRYE